VKKQKPPQLEKLTRRIASLDERDVDQLYGLEPIYEPSRDLKGLPPEQWVAVLCPYCGERLQMAVDITAGERDYIEDCEVCCRPIECGIELEANGALRALKVQRMD
jgi:cysteine-rich CPXCG protein